MREVLVIAGPSAVGKTTVAEALMARDGRFELVRSVTTRKKRPDAFGSEYIYLEREEFLSLVENGGVLEYTEYSGELYGTPRSEIERIHGAGRYPLLILDLDGVRSLSEKPGIRPAAVYLYDSLAVMERRLSERYLLDKSDKDGQRKLDSRMAQNRRDYAKIANYASHFDAFIPNSAKIEDTVEAVLAHFASFLLGPSRDEEKIGRALGEIENEIRP